MFILLEEPSGGSTKEAFEVLDTTFGSGSFTSGQAINAISIALEESPAKAQALFNKLVVDRCVGEEE